MGKKMADKAAPGSFDAAAKGEGKNHQHHHYHRAQTAAPADSRVDCVADINGRAGAYIEGFYRKLEDQEMIKKNNTSSTTTATTAGGALSLTSLNHISLVCRSVEESLKFYQDVLGFNPIRRPKSPKFDGAWLFNYGMIIHLLQSEDPEGMPKKSEINLKDNHFSFQCENMAAVERKLSEMGILYIKEGAGVSVDQLFFHDPDGFMIEICNREVLPVVLLGGASDPVSVCKRVTAAANTGSTP